MTGYEACAKSHSATVDEEGGKLASSSHHDVTNS
jgi:hypothetical protein